MIKVLWILPGSEGDEQNLVFARRGLPKLREAGAQVDCCFLESRTSPLYLLRSWFRVRRMMKTHHYDVIHAQYGSITAVFAWLLGQPYVVTFRGSDINGDPDMSKLRQWTSLAMSFWAALCARTRICVSSQLAEKLPFQTMVLPSPMDLDLFQPIDKLTARQKIGAPLNEILIGFAGGSRPMKRKDLAQAACDIAGYKLFEIQNVKPAQMPLWLCACDALIFTSEREGSPNIVREALACGVPVASVNVGDVADWLKQDPSSRLASTRQPQALADALREIVSLGSKRERRADLGRLSAESHAQRMLEIYQGLKPSHAS